MTERAYTVKEIDALRWTVKSKLLFGEYNPRDAVSTRQVSHTDVEEVVRTHMLAGHTAADLYASEQTQEAPATAQQAAGE